MNKQTTVRLPQDVAEAAQKIAEIKGTSLNQLIVQALEQQIEEVRKDKKFMDEAKKLVQRDKNILDKLSN
ncbi:MAG: YlcI/YnfO family protein [Actinomycetes bacterium]